MKKTTTLAALMAAMLGAASTTAPEVINNTPGISQQQAAQNGLPFVPGRLAHESGLPPKYYSIRLQQTGQQWKNLRARRSRKYTG